MCHVHRIGLAVVVVVLSATACTQSPTADQRHFSRMGDGLGLGSGHIVAAVDTQTAAVSYETTADTTGRNGLGFGSGH